VIAEEAVERTRQIAVPDGQRLRGIAGQDRVIVAAEPIEA
jgi:hypothetical protein